MTARWVTAVAAAMVWIAGGVGEGGAQPEFPHKYHLEDEELQCVDCHTAASSSSSAADDLLPESSVCLDCHDEGDVPMTWEPVERQVRFDHEYHLETVGLECTTCHAGVPAADPKPGAALPAMAICSTCHDGVAAPRDCANCHTEDIADLRPDTHDPGWSQGHGPTARTDEASCLPCHAVNDCQECHDGALLTDMAALGAAMTTPFAPQLAGSSGLVVNRVHGLNYRLLHPLQARGKNLECITCHELDAGDFCAECHNPELNSGIRPVWHGGPGWGALAAAVGSGGGRHAELARRDMENCAACHDVGGDDPTCLQCHMDRSPGIGNDPRTHSGGFADDVGEGEFHDDDGALCFTCHTFRGPAGGNGFCGYCHGPIEP